MAYTAPGFASKHQLYQDLKIAQAQTLQTPKERRESLAKILAVLTGCELDNLCVYMMMKQLSTREDNLLYIHYYNRLLKKRDDILYDTLHCQSPELDQTRATMSSCLSRVSQRLIDAKDTKQVANAERALGNCTLNRVSKIAKNGNVFAQGIMLRYEIARANAKGIDHWYNLMKRYYPTQQYQVYTQCEDKY